MGKNSSTNHKRSQTFPVVLAPKNATVALILSVFVHDFTIICCVIQANAVESRSYFVLDPYFHCNICN